MIPSITTSYLIRQRPGFERLPESPWHLEYTLLSPGYRILESCPTDIPNVYICEYVELDPSAIDRTNGGVTS